MPLPLLLLLAAAASSAHAFTFEFNQTNPRTCEPVLVSWKGGSPPFRLMIIPAFDYPFTVDMANTTWDSSSSSGSYVWHANYPDTIGGFLAVMSDSAGLATGGVSSIMYMSTGGSKDDCTIRPEASDFLFYLDPQDGLVGQCESLGISWSSNATDPVQIVGVIPNGNAFVLPTDDDTNGRKWKVNIASGTNYILTMLDGGAIGNGGSSNFMLSGASNDTSCMDAAAPSRTPGSTWGTPDGKAATTAAPEASGSSSSSSKPSGGGSSTISTGGIVGAVIGGLIAVAAVQIALVWCLCRNRFRRTLAKTPVDLFSTKNEGQEVGAPVTSSGRRNFLGRRTQRDVSQYQPEPYYVQPDGSRSDDRLASAIGDGEGGGGGGGDPFQDEDGYLYPAGGMGDWSRRGSSASNTEDGSPDSPGIGMRLLGSSRSPLSATNSDHTLATPNSQTAFLDSSDSRSPTYDGPRSAGGQPQQQVRASRPPRTSSISSSLPSTVPPYPTPQNVRQTKAMLALSNPDERPGPSFRRHRDAGPLETDGPAPVREGETVDLPPLYDDIAPLGERVERREEAREEEEEGERRNDGPPRLTLSFEEELRDPTP